MKTNIILVIPILALCGCATLRKAGDAAFTLGKVAAPQYATTIEQIRKAVATGDTSPVDGFEFSRTYFYRGVAVANPGDITWEDAYTRIGSASQSNPPATASTKPESAADAKLRADIEAILTAAGVAP
jgi:hypothetical protein